MSISLKTRIISAAFICAFVFTVAWMMQMVAKEKIKQSYDKGYAKGFADMQFDLWRAVEHMDKIVIGPLVPGSFSEIRDSLILCPSCETVIYGINVRDFLIMDIKAVIGDRDVERKGSAVFEFGN